MSGENYILAGAAFLTFGVVASSTLMAFDSDDEPQTITPVEECAMSMSEAQAEDDLCVSWVDEDGNVIVGPAWLK